MTFAFCFDLTYEGLKCLFFLYAHARIEHVLILPMRDWNLNMTLAMLVAKTVLILPMRDWNTIWFSLARLNPKSFDLTYEGLKFNHIHKTFIIHVFVLILPMRDWNLALSHQLWCDRLVLILPMRDWNQVGEVVKVPIFKFWSYLWGIEILPPRITRGSQKTFWSYLWGIEIISFAKSYAHFLAFWSYLWGIEI